MLLVGCAAGDGEAPAGAEAVRGDLAELVRDGAVGAIATVTVDDATTVLTAGVADLAVGAAIPVDPAQHVRIGSITKTFTAALVVGLAAEGRIDLDRPVEAYLPGLLAGAGPAGVEITVRQLLGHRSGLLDPPLSPEVDEYEAARTGRTYTPGQEVAMVVREPTGLAPGARFEYANINYLVAGMLVEAVTGGRFADELRARILVPLGLSDTYLPETGETGLRSPHPTGYANIGGVVTDTTRIEPSLPWASGAMVSTGADLNRFFAALRAGRVVPESRVPEMLDGVDMGSGSGFFYGLGVSTLRLPCGADFVGNVGGVRGFTAMSGTTAAGRSVTVSFTGTTSSTDIPGLLARALCG
ncbi:serine hydrolase domain-containing protein [Nocardia sp. NPDC057668]|uniref:serine hydrolase domain-containing protein n=1 Tax=Nocardia sp. NPDC057668 TaxID=3346202 RepID=UPI00366F2643